MKKYKTDGHIHIDFMSELDKISLDDAEDVCLITNLKLTEHYVTLECNHTFNYKPLYTDILSLKSTRSSLMTYRIHIDQIQCPYCRNIQNKLLPHIPSLKLAKRNGVNWIDITSCVPENVIVTHKTGVCGNDHCQKETQLFSENTEETYYCYEHFIPRFKSLDVKPKKRRLNAPGNTIENMVIASTTPSVPSSSLHPTPTLCCAVLKSGMRKGQTCNARAKVNGCCLRHKSVV